MTLVLTAATPAFVIQAADRLTTKKRVMVSTHDPIANKTVLYRANDAIAVLSFSGLAYRGQQPTDEWLADLLWGGSFPRGADGIRPAVFGVARRPNVWSINRAIRALRDAIDAIPQVEIDLGGLFVAITGWRNNRGVVRPFVTEILRGKGAMTAAVSGTKMRWPVKKPLCLGQIGALMSNATLNAAFDPFREEGILRDVDAEQTLVELIRKQSARQSTVGPNVFSLVLPKPGTGPIVGRFHAAVTHQAEVVAASAVYRVEVAHTPWVLWSMGWFAPQTLAGDMMGDLDGVPFEIKGAALATGPILGLSSAIARPGP